MSDERRILTTGIINRHINTEVAHVEIVNLDPDSDRRITVQAYRWDLGVGSTLLSQQTFNLSPNQFLIFNQDVANTFHYEIRLLVRNDEDVVVNIFGTSGPDLNVNHEGNTFYYSQLTEVELD